MSNFHDLAVQDLQVQQLPCVVEHYDSQMRYERKLNTVRFSAADEKINRPHLPQEFLCSNPGVARNAALVNCNGFDQCAHLIAGSQRESIDGASR